MQHIIENIARICGVTVEELRSPCRESKRVIARNITANLLNKAGLSRTGIGEEVNRDRSTVQHMIDTHESNLQTWKLYKTLYDKVMEDKRISV